MFTRQIIDIVENSKKSVSLLHLVGLRPRVYYTLTNFRGGGGKAPSPQYANEYSTDHDIGVSYMYILRHFVSLVVKNSLHIPLYGCCGKRYFETIWQKDGIWIVLVYILILFYLKNVHCLTMK